MRLKVDETRETLENHVKHTQHPHKTLATYV
jgi:hypothetical protein